MARPKKPDHERRTISKTFWVTAIEDAQIEHTAAATGLGQSEFMRRRCSGVRLPPASGDRQLFAEATTALLRLGVNLNQVAKHMNAGRDAPPGQLADLITRINSALDMLDESRGIETRPEL